MCELSFTQLFTIVQSYRGDQLLGLKIIPNVLKQKMSPKILEPQSLLHQAEKNPPNTRMFVPVHVSEPFLFIKPLQYSV